jgi:hypothetical protein
MADLNQPAIAPNALIGLAQALHPAAPGQAQVPPQGQVGPQGVNSAKSSNHAHRGSSRLRNSSSFIRLTILGPKLRSLVGLSSRNHAAL